MEASNSIQASVSLVDDPDEQVTEAKPILPPEVAIGDFADMEVNEDQLGIHCAGSPLNLDW